MAWESIKYTDYLRIATQLIDHRPHMDNKKYYAAPYVVLESCDAADVGPAVVTCAVSPVVVGTAALLG